MKHIIIFCCVFCSLEAFSKEPYPSEIEDFSIRSELMLHVGVSRFDNEGPVQQDDSSFSQLGYDLKAGMFYKKFLFHGILNGYKPFSDISSNSSGIARMGLGAFWFQKKHELLLEFIRTKEAFLEKDADKLKIIDFISYHFGLHWAHETIVHKGQYTIGPIIGAGLITSGEKKIFKYNSGFSTKVGIRVKKKETVLWDENFLAELIWERNLIKTSISRQEQNIGILRLGKRF